MRPRQHGYWWYLLPIGVGFTAVVAVPFAANVVLSFFRYCLPT